MTVTLPGPFDDSTFYSELAKAANKLGDLIETDFAATTATWNKQPKFDRSFHQTANETSVLISTKNRIYRFLAGGTKKRYLVMTPNFIPKTRRRVLGSYPGQGGPDRWDFNQQRARARRIEARDWDYAIVEKHRRKAEAYLERAMNRGARATGHSYP